jgi:precorrin-2/cobalt-factor-2 C20-methyltransferase
MAGPDSKSDEALLVGVGVGPGDPSHLTLGALAALEGADRVVAPTTELGSAGRAETIVRSALPELSVERLLFDMSADGATGRAARTASHLAAARRLLPWLGDGQRVAFITLGDPNIFSTFPALVTQLRELGWRGAVRTVPGITAFQALAAQSATVLLDGTETLALVTALDGTDDLEHVVDDPERAVVVYKGGRHLPAVARVLSERERLVGAVYGERLGLPDERVASLVDIGDGPASYLATVIVPPKARAERTREQ